MDRNIFLNALAKEVMEETLPKFDNICKCDKCLAVIHTSLCDSLNGNQYFIEQCVKIDKRAQGVDIQIKAEAIREIFTIIEQLKTKPRH